MLLEIDPAYAAKTVQAAAAAGAHLVVLCDTNGGTMPEEISELTKAAQAALNVPVGIHTHNDCDLAVANSLASVAAGAGPTGTMKQAPPRSNQNRPRKHAENTKRFIETFFTSSLPVSQDWRSSAVLQQQKNRFNRQGAKPAKYKWAADALLTPSSLIPHPS